MQLQLFGALYSARGTSAVKLPHSLPSKERERGTCTPEIGSSGDLLVHIRFVHQQNCYIHTLL